MMAMLCSSVFEQSLSISSMVFQTCHVNETEATQVGSDHFDQAGASVDIGDFEEHRDLKLKRGLLVSDVYTV